MSGRVAAKNWWPTCSKRHSTRCSRTQPRRPTHTSNSSRFERRATTPCNHRELWERVSSGTDLHIKLDNSINGSEGCHQLAIVSSYIGRRSFRGHCSLVQCISRSENCERLVLSLGQRQKPIRRTRLHVLLPPLAAALLRRRNNGRPYFQEAVVGARTLPLGVLLIVHESPGGL